MLIINMDPIFPQEEDTSTPAFPPAERPKFQPNALKNRTRVRLDSEDSTFCQKNADFYFSSPNSDVSLQRAQSIAQERGGECLSSYCEDDWQPLKFRCALSHVWETNEVLLNGSWCYQCQAILKRAKDFASSQGGICLNEYCSPQLSFMCGGHHQWEADAFRYSKRWCNQCKASEKKRRKEEVAARRRRADEEEAQAQEEMLRAARARMLSNPTPQMVVVAECEIDSVARDLTGRFLSNPTYKGECSYEDAFLVYKVLQSPEDFLKQRYFAAGNAGSVYRQIARLLHPDKNKHPLASEAFFKVSRLFEYNC